MKSYTINNKIFFNICSVHDEINNIIIPIMNNEVCKELKDKLQNVIELVYLAKQMGQRMEYGLTKRSFMINDNTCNIFNIGSVLFNLDNNLEE